MSPSFDARLAALALELPPPRAPGANYVPVVRVGDLLFVSGQLSQWNQELRHRGKLGRDLDVDAGRQAARVSALNLLAQLRAALGGSLDRVVRCVRVAGYVNATDDFEDHSQVVNGASDLLLEVFGDAGKHTRVAVGVTGLPRGFAVEVEAVFQVADGPT